MSKKLEHLESIAKGYSHTVDEESRAHPICYCDTEIIREIILILGSIKGTKKFQMILEKWKAIPDDEILDDLRELDHKFDYDYFIKVGDLEFNANLLVTVRSIELWEDSQYKFGLLLNEEPIPDKMNFLRNKTIFFNSEQEREDALKEMKARLTEFINIMFL
jgi:hypothetical protein